MAAFTSDATNAADMDALAQRIVEEFGPVDVLVNSVGESFRHPLVPLPDEQGDALTPEYWKAFLDLNLSSVYQGCRAFGPHLLNRRRGSVINVSSFASIQARPNMTVYAAAKAGITRFTESLAMEWGPHGVRGQRPFAWRPFPTSPRCRRSSSVSTANAALTTFRWDVPAR